MNAGLLWLHDVRRGDSAVAGGKGANLGELAGSGFPIPPGFVVPSQAYALVVESMDLDEQLRALRGLPAAEANPRWSSLRARIEGAELPPELADAILAAHQRLLGGRGASVLCAVRSSATAEDLGAASFAGQHGTYYYVDASRLLKMVTLCWASLWRPEALSYRAVHGIDHASVSMAVIVQEMIPSEVSGVTFTANPVTGSGEELVVESSWGMGAALVDGRVTPDRYRVSRDGLRLRERRIAEKRFMVGAHPGAEREARLEDVPHGMRRRETLSPGLLRTVAEWALRAEAHFGRPQDVEWAIAQGGFYLLQSRPITATGREDIGAGIEGRYVLFKPLLENFTDPVTPLTEDLILAVRPPLIRLVRGWFYLDVDSLRRFLPLEVSAEDLAEHLYSMSQAPPPWKLSPAKMPLAVLLLALGYLAVAVLLARTRSLPDDALAPYRALCRRVDEDPSLGPEDALRRLFVSPRMLDPVGHMAVLVNIATIRFLPWMAVLRRLLRRWAPGLRPDADVLLGSGSEGVLSAEMGRGVWDLAQEAQRSPRVAEVLAREPLERVLPLLAEEPKAREFLDRLQGFLATNGHRALKELELRSVRWEEDPAPVLAMVRNYLAVGSSPPDNDRRAAETRAALAGELRRALEARPLEGALGVRFRLIRFAAERVKYFLKLRENSRFYHIMGFGTIRKKVLRIEAELMRLGRLKCRDDIFFLHAEEVAGLQAGRLGWLDVEGRIRERRLAHIRLCKMGPPKTLGITSKGPPGGSAPEGPLLRGQSASPGRYEGTARVILDLSLDFELKPGEVLVAPYTDPAWTPLFLTAGAAVVEVGSFLSHAGTVAREFGMPCVMDVAGATERIRTGDRIGVDGDAGTVRLLRPGAGAPT